MKNVICVYLYMMVSHTYCVVFLFRFFFILCTLLPASLDCSFLFALLYSLTFIYVQYIDQKKKIKTIAMDDKILHRQLQIDRH